MKFTYLAKNKDGQMITGIVESANENLAASALSDRGLEPVSLTAENEAMSKDLDIPFLNRIKPKDLVVMSRQLSVLVSATVPIVRAIKILVQQTKNVKLQNALKKIADDVDGGSKLSDSMARFANIFSNFFVSMIRSGESSGKLDEVLNYLADQTEKDYELRSKIKGAMVYPAFIMTSMFGLGAAMMIFVVPKLTAVLLENGGELPLTTKMLIAVSGFLVNYWWIVLIALIGSIVGIKYALKVNKIKVAWDEFKLHIPVLGKLFQFTSLVRFTRSLQTLVTGGVPLPDALEIVAAVVGNETYRTLLLNSIKSIEQGQSLSYELSKSKVVPQMIHQMINVGEQTGKLTEILGRITDFYTREINTVVASLVTLIEPMIMILLGVAVGAMVSAVLLPMYNMAQNF